MKKTNTKKAVLVALLLAGGFAGLMAQDTPATPATPGAPPPTPGTVDRTTSQSDRQSRYDKQQTSDTTAGQSSSQPMKINKASSLIGTTVKNQQGEDVGKIRDLVIDFTGDRVAYCVLGVSPGVFNAEKLHAVPLRAFQPGADGNSLTLNIEKEKLARSEGFDKNNWPTMSNPAWGAEIQSIVPGAGNTNTLDVNGINPSRTTPNRSFPDRTSPDRTVPDRNTK